MKWKSKCRIKINGKFYWEKFLFLPLKCGDEWRWLVNAKFTSRIPYPLSFDREWI